MNTTIDGEKLVEMPVEATSALHHIPMVDLLLPSRAARAAMRLANMKALRLLLPLYGPKARGRAIWAIENLSRQTTDGMR